MSELTVGTLSGLAANSYVIDVASGSQLTQPGMVLQVVSTTKTDTFSTSSGTYVDITGLSATITPSSTSSKIMVIVSLIMGNGTDNGGRAFAQVLRDSTALGNNTGLYLDASMSMVTEDTPNNVSRSVFTGSFNYLDSPATTSATTYKVQFASEGGLTSYINRAGNTSENGGSSHITLMEIAG